MSNPTGYYTISNDDKMMEAVVRRGVQMMEAVGVNANITVTAPLV